MIQVWKNENEIGCIGYMSVVMDLEHHILQLLQTLTLLSIPTFCELISSTKCVLWFLIFPLCLTKFSSFTPYFPRTLLWHNLHFILILLCCSCLVTICSSEIIRSSLSVVRYVFLDFLLIVLPPVNKKYL